MWDWQGKIKQFVNVEFDYIKFTWSGGKVSKIEFYIDGSLGDKVAEVNFTWNGDDIDNISKTYLQ